MKRPLLSIAALLLLAACNGNTASVTYDLGLNVTDATKRQQIAEQALNVAERRLDRMGEAIMDKSASVNDSTATITIKAEHPEALDALTQELTAPFSLRIMAEAPEGEATLIVEGHGGFKDTTITEEDLSWVEGRKEPGKNKGEVQLVFTETGRSEMAELFATMQGKVLGLFVRDQLVSKLQVDTNELKDDIVIRDIPSPELAVIFAEDVNVGIHTTFTPVP